MNHPTPLPTFTPHPEDRPTPAELQAANAQLACLSPLQLLQWGQQQFGPEMVVATSFGLSGMVILHTVAQMKPRPTIFYLQTDLFFPETLALRDELAARFNLEFLAVTPDLTLAAQAAQHGPELWQRNPDLCCRLRKVEPLRRFLRDKKAWVTGVRRDQSTSRAHVDLLAWDEAHHVLKLNPLALWTRSRVWRYIQTNRLPYNALHDQGYPSIGCWPCTQPATDQDERNGRWPNSTKTECGIHLPNHP